MKKLGFFALALGMVLALARPAQAGTEKHRYVAQGDNFVLLAFVSGWTGMPMRGTVSFVPSSNRATIHIADVKSKGTVPLVLSSADGVRRTCGAANTTVTDLVPGQRVWVYVLDGAHRGRCDAGGTTGVLTILG